MSMIIADNSSRSEPGTLHPSDAAFIGFSPAMQAIFYQIECASRSAATVFISGESGTGKELCALAIHRLGHRAGKAFIPINCAAIPRDLLESELFGHIKGAFTGAISDRDGAIALAHGGTLFLDEIAEMAPDMQTKLLRFLQDFSYRRIGSGKQEIADIRLICATNRDAVKEIALGRLRQDLYYRLHVIPIHMPPLRARGQDIIDIGEALLLRYAHEEGKEFHGFSAEAEQLLLNYSWPGNIRELQNVLRYIAVMHHGEIVTAAMLPEEIHQTPGSPTTSDTISPLLSAAGWSPVSLREAEARAIEQALIHCQGSVPRAAALLGIAPSTLYRRQMERPLGPHDSVMKK